MGDSRDRAVRPDGGRARAVARCRRTRRAGLRGRRRRCRGGRGQPAGQPRRARRRARRPAARRRAQADGPHAARRRVAAAHRARSGLRRRDRLRRPHPDRRPRGGRCRRDRGASGGRPPVHGACRRPGHADRRGPREDRRDRTHGRDPGQQRRARQRRMGAGDGVAVRAGAQCHGRHRQRRTPLPAGRRGRAADPDRRGDQRGQLRRAAVQPARPGRRAEHDDLLQQRRLHGRVARGPDQPGDAARRRVARVRAHRARPARRRSRS